MRKIRGEIGGLIGGIISGKKKLLEKSVKIMIGKISRKIGGKLIENLVGKLNLQQIHQKDYLTRSIH